jgi:hypothetical protein
MELNMDDLKKKAESTNLDDKAMEELRRLRTKHQATQNDQD